MSNYKIFTAVLLASALAGAACAYAGPGGGGRGGGGRAYYGGGRAYYGDGVPYAMGGRRDSNGMRGRGDIYVNVYVDGEARHGRASVAHDMVYRRFGGRRVFVAHGKPDVDGHHGIRLSHNRHESRPGLHRAPSLRRHTAETAPGSRAEATVPRNTAHSRFSGARAQIIANPVTPGDRRSRRGWRDRNGGWGWGGPVSYAYNDIYDYALWGDGDDEPFWDHGYGDIYAGMFTPYRRDESAVDRPQNTGSRKPPVHPRPGIADTARPKNDIKNDIKNDVKDDGNLQPKAAASVPSKSAVTAQREDSPRPQPQPQATARIPQRGAVTARTDDPPKTQTSKTQTSKTQPQDTAAAQPKRTVTAQTDDAPKAQPRDPVGATWPAPQAVAPNRAAQRCGEDSRDIADLPIDRIQAAIKPNDVQRAALDDLGNASVQAAEIIRSTCPTEVVLTAPGRLAAMQQRLESMISAVDTIQPALRAFNDLLSDDQKARLTTLGNDKRRAPTASSTKDVPAATCDTSQNTVPALPIAEIEARLHPTESQRRDLVALQKAAARAADMLNVPCPSSAEAVSPPARLEAVRKRLDLTKQAITIVLAALDDFYGDLSEQQKTEFEAIGQAPAPDDQPGTARPAARHPRVGFDGDVQSLTSIAQD